MKYKITIEIITDVPRENGYVSEETKEIYMQKVDAIDVSSISKLVNDVQSNHERMRSLPTSSLLSEDSAL